MSLLTLSQGPVRVLKNPKKDEVVLLGTTINRKTVMIIASANGLKIEEVLIGRAVKLSDDQDRWEPVTDPNLAEVMTDTVNNLSMEELLAITTVIANSDQPPADDQRTKLSFEWDGHVYQPVPTDAKLVSDIVEYSKSGPVLVTGRPGTGKTYVTQLVKEQLVDTLDSMVDVTDIDSLGEVVETDEGPKWYIDTDRIVTTSEEIYCGISDNMAEVIFEMQPDHIFILVAEGTNLKEVYQKRAADPGYADFAEAFAELAAQSEDELETGQMAWLAEFFTILEQNWLGEINPENITIINNTH